MGAFRSEKNRHGRQSEEGKGEPSTFLTTPDCCLRCSPDEEQADGATAPLVSSSPGGWSGSASSSSPLPL